MQRRQALSLFRRSTSILDNAQTYGHTTTKPLLLRNSSESQISDKVVRQVTDQLALQVKPTVNASGQTVLYVGKRQLSDIVAESAHKRNVGPLVKALGMDTTDPSLKRLVNTQVSDSEIQRSIRNQRQTIIKDLEAHMSSPAERRLLHSTDPLPELDSTPRLSSNSLRPPKRKAPQPPSSSAGRGESRPAVPSSEPKTTGSQIPGSGQENRHAASGANNSGVAPATPVRRPQKPLKETAPGQPPLQSSPLLTMERIWRNAVVVLKASAVAISVAVAGHSLASWLAEYKLKNSGAFSRTSVPYHRLTRLSNLSCGCSDTTTGAAHHIYHDKIAGAVSGIENACTSTVGLPDGVQPTSDCGNWLEFGPNSRLQRLGLLNPGDTDKSPLGPNTTYECKPVPTNGEALVELVHATGMLVGELAVSAVSGVAEGLGLGAFGKVLAATVISALAGVSCFYVIRGNATLAKDMSPKWIGVCVTIFVFIVCVYMFFFTTPPADVVT